MPERSNDLTFDANYYKARAHDTPLVLRLGECAYCWSAGVAETSSSSRTHNSTYICTRMPRCCAGVDGDPAAGGGARGARAAPDDARRARPAPRARGARPDRQGLRRVPAEDAGEARPCRLVREVRACNSFCKTMKPSMCAL